MTTRTDHAEISMLVDRFFKALDNRELTADRWRGPFMDDVRMETPLGTSQGADAVRATEEALERYERTQHIAGGVLVDADADAGAVGASVSWNALMTHVHRAATLQARGGDADPLFAAGGRFEAVVRRTADGWRFSRIVVRPICTKGRPPVGVDVQ
ncbi:nuclear transport factor 2 family protein [Streptomyces sp. NPDC014748]|uniref:nuclear transport factor 2 family protein n=1 Tax=Streptomyces sp. NPDC014748 TaxID=3364905 RepID=UPI003703500E